MEIQPPDHRWDISPKEAIEVQKLLRSRVRLKAPTKQFRWIAGADISFNKYSPTVYAAIVVLDAQTLELVDHSSAVLDVKFPYVPGLLSFREAPALLEALKSLKTEPDVFVLDGQGIAHPRRFGIASHVGVVLNRPTIGCAKKPLCGVYDEPGPKPGDCTPLVYQDEIIGAVLRTKKNTKPVFVSPGHLMDLNTSIELMMKMARGYRIPEPTRRAHLFVNQLRIKAMS